MGRCCLNSERLFRGQDSLGCFIKISLSWENSWHGMHIPLTARTAAGPAALSCSPIHSHIHFRQQSQLRTKQRAIGPTLAVYAGTCLLFFTRYDTQSEKTKITTPQKSPTEHFIQDEVLLLPTVNQELGFLVVYLINKLIFQDNYRVISTICIFTRDYVGIVHIFCTQYTILRHIFIHSAANTATLNTINCNLLATRPDFPLLC